MTLPRRQASKYMNFIDLKQNTGEYQQIQIKHV